MKNRIAINLVFFAALAAVLAVWAVTTVIKLDAVERPYRITAEFTSSPGLRPDLEVTYLGVRIGEVDRVALETGKVTVEVAMDRTAKVPREARAEVLRKSAIGEPYIEFSPPSNGGDGAYLRDGDRVPLSRTAVAGDYKRLFEGAGELLRAAKPADVRILVHELAVGLDQRGDTLHDLVADTHQLTGTLAANAGVLDELATNLTGVTSILAGHRSELEGGFNSLAKFTESLRSSTGTAVSVLDRGPGFLGRTAGLLDASWPSLSCLLTASGAPSTPLFTPEMSDRVHDLLRQFPAADEVVDNVVVAGPDGSRHIRAKFAVSMSGPAPAEEYENPRRKPMAPAAGSCAGGAAAAASGGSGGATASATPGTASTPRQAATDPRPTAVAGAPWWPWALAAAGVLAAALAALTLTRRRRS